MTRIRSIFILRVVAALVLSTEFQLAMADNDIFIIDDRSVEGPLASSGGEWRLITDGVMGGVSHGRLSADRFEDRPCLRLSGRVKLDNNGGFVQAALDLPEAVLREVPGYTGLTLTVRGNRESYNVHLRTRDNRLPWQSYRAAFSAAPEWKTVRLPFAGFSPHRTSAPLDPRRLRRIGIVAIGREFEADLCLASMGLYR